MTKKVARNEDRTSSTAVEKLDYDGYNDVTIAAQLRDIKLVRCDYSIKPEVFDAVEELEGMSHAFFGESNSFFFDSEGGLAMGHYRWNAELKFKRKKVLKLVCDYLIAYTGLEGMEEKNVRFFFDKVGRFATYPYFRAEFSQSSSASGIMLPPLPSLNERVN